MSGLTAVNAETGAIAWQIDGQDGESDATPVPVLAKSCTPNDSLDVWTCKLRADVRFHDGSVLDANDVVLSYAVQWDAAHPRHRGRNGTFQGFVDRFGPLLNLPAGS